MGRTGTELSGVGKTKSLVVISPALGSFRVSEATQAQFMAPIRQSQYLLRITSVSERKRAGVTA